jgi:hypothetical protein
MRRPLRRLLSPALAVLALSACGGSGDPGPRPPPPTGLTYSVPAAIYTVNVEIPDNVPHLDAGVARSYGIEPSLPAGLSFDTTSGVISGTPTGPSPTAMYVVTAENAYGKATATLSIAVNASPPTNLTYAPQNPSYPVGMPITPNVPSNAGGQIAMYSVAPALPPGLSLDPATGIISGTPTTMAPAASFVVTGVNGYGSTQSTLSIAITDVPPAGLTYAWNPALYPRGIAIPPSVPSHTGGAVSSYSVSPDLPAGLAMDPSTGAITGTPTTVTPAADYTVTATNTGGSAQAIVRIEVAILPTSTVTGSMSVARAQHAATLLQDGTVLVTGGQNATNSAIASAELYLPASGSFSSTAAGKTLTMTAARYGHTATRLQSGKVLISGGWNGTTTGGSAELYDPAAGTFTATGPMTTPRQYHSATLLPSGKVLIAGGITLGNVNKSAELYDPSTGNFTATGSMTVARSSHAAVLLGTGKVLLAGGASDASAELYDPATGTFTATAGMTAPNNRAAAVLLPSGKVFLAGQGDLEFFDPAAPGFTHVGDGLGSPSVSLWIGTAPIVAWAAQSSTDDPDMCGTLYDSWGQYTLIDAATGAARYNQWLDGFLGTATTLATGEVLFTGGYRSYTNASNCHGVSVYFSNAHVTKQ